MFTKTLTFVVENGKVVNTVVKFKIFGILIFSKIAKMPPADVEQYEVLNF